MHLSTITVHYRRADERTAGVHVGRALFKFITAREYFSSQSRATDRGLRFASALFLIPPLRYKSSSKCSMKIHRRHGLLHFYNVTLMHRLLGAPAISTFREICFIFEIPRGDNREPHLPSRMHLRTRIKHGE